MAGISTTWVNNILNATLRGDASAFPPTISLGLYVGDPLVSGLEVSGTGYAAQSVTFHAPSGRAVTNHETVTFPIAESNWGTVTHLGVKTAAGVVVSIAFSGGGREMVTGSQMKFFDGSISIYLP